MPTVGSRESALRASRLCTIQRWGVCAALSLGVLGLGFAGCATLPGAKSSWTVESAVVRGAYLDVSFATGGSTRRFFTAATDPCKSLLKAEAIVDYVNLGPLGQFQSGDVTCIPAGIGSLGAWRDERPRPQVGPLPQKQANFRLEFQDQDVVMLRGMFPLLGLIAWPGLGDTVVVLPQTPPCQALVPGGVATIEYRVAGPDPFVLLDNEKRCALAGLIQPTGER
jgi:hypothetical protein